MRTVYANALLSDGAILFWYTGDECNGVDDFYKDFYYAGISQLKYQKSHDLRLAKMGFIDPTEDEDYNKLCFNVLAKDFYRQFPISRDSRGERAY